MWGCSVHRTRCPIKSPNRIIFSIFFLFFSSFFFFFLFAADDASFPYFHYFQFCISLDFILRQCQNVKISASIECGCISDCYNIFFDWMLDIMSQSNIMSRRDSGRHVISDSYCQNVMPECQNIILVWPYDRISECLFMSRHKVVPR